MKANSAVAGILRRHPLRCIIILSGMIMLLRFIVTGVFMMPDSVEYVAAADTVFRDSVDLIRTPSYPLVIRLMQVLLGGYYGYGVVLLQVVVTLVSLKYLWCLCQRVTPRTGIVAAVVAVYGLMPFVLKWSVYILTESLSVSGIIFLLWTLVKIYDCPRPRYTLGLSLLALFLTFLRPALLYMLVAMAIVAILWLCQRRRRQALSLGVAVMLSLVSLYGYCKVFESKNGAFMLTAVSVLNDEIILSSDGLYRDLSFADGELNELLAEFPQGDTLSMDARYHWLVQLRYSYPMPVHKRFLSEARRQIGARWYAHAAIRFFESMNEKPFLGVDDPFYGYLMDSMFHLRLSVFYLLTAIYALVFLKQVVKRRSANWLSLAVLLVCWGQVGVMFLGTYCDYSRMVMPAVPAACVMVSQLLSCFRVKMSPAVLASFGAPPAPTAREF